MIISLVQQDIIWEDRAANLSALEKLLEPLHGVSDLVILPEMFNSGFSMDPGKIAERPGGTTMEWMLDQARKGDFGICGSYTVEEEGRFFNRFVFASPASEVIKYDKRHLFGLAGERDLFSPGFERTVFRFRGMRIFPLVCYDLRFPVWSRNKNDYDLLIYPANWPASRNLAWNTLLRARAIENQCYTAGVNRVGTDGSGTSYCGESAVYRYDGETVAFAGSSGEAVISALISSEELISFRKKFPFLDDADKFTIEV